MYSGDLDADEQVSAEEAIAAHIFDNTTADEEVSAQLGREILEIILKRFRPDLIVP